MTVAVPQTGAPVDAVAAQTEPAISLAGIALFSHGADSLARFYTHVLGVPLEHRMHDDQREHFVGRIGDVHFEIKALVKQDGDPTPDGVTAEALSAAELSVQVSDVDAAVARALENGASLVAEACDFSWGRYAVVRDPDGNRLGLYAPQEVTHGNA